MRKNNKKKFKLIYLLIIIIFVFLIAGVILAFLFLKEKEVNSPIEVTKRYLDNYNSLSKEVISNIKYEFEDNLDENQKKIYAKAIRRQYEKMDYSIIKDDISDKNATIKVEVTVYDYNNCWYYANNYISKYSYRFNDNIKKVDYKINQLLTCNDKVTHTIDFKYVKNDKKWVMKKITDDDYRKLNGTY